MVALAAFTANATDFTWTGNTERKEDWFDSNNWTVSSTADNDHTYPQAEDTATFNEDVTLNVDNEITVGELILNANLTHRRDKWLTVGAVSGTGEIILINRGRLRNTNGTALTLANNVRITSSDSTDYDNTNAMPWIQANGENITFTGSLLGEGAVFCTMAGNKGVLFAGDNSAFTGTVVLDGNPTHRAKFAAETAGFANGRLVIKGTVTDNGSMTFSDGTIHFGSIYTPEFSADAAYFRSIDKNNTLVIGNLNRGDDRLTLTMGDDANAHAAIVKVGTGTLELGPTRHRDGTIISNGTLRILHNDGLCHKDSSLTFAGGALEYGVNPSTETAITKDVSALVTGSTEFIKVATTGADVTWASSVIYNNNPSAKGVWKLGEGTLDLTGSNRDGTWKFFSEATSTNRIDGGTLAIRNGKSNTTPSLNAGLLGTGTLLINGEEADGGWRIYGGGTALDAFEGTIEWANTLDQSGKAVGFMLNNNHLDMHLARFRVTGNPAEDTMVMNGEANSSRIVTVAAFDHLYPTARLSMKSPWGLTIAGTAGESYLNGPIVTSKVTINKNGVGSLKLGPGFSVVDGSAVNVNAGVLDVQCDLSGTLNYTLAIASGVELSGAGTVTAAQLASGGTYKVTADGGDVLTVSGEVDLSNLTIDLDVTGVGDDTEAVYTLLRADSFSSSPSQVACAALETLNATATGGTWRLSKESDAQGETLVLRFFKNGFLILVR